MPPRVSKRTPDKGYQTPCFNFKTVRLEIIRLLGPLVVKHMSPPLNSPTVLHCQGTQGLGAARNFFPGNSDGTICRSRQSECRMFSTSIFGLALLTQHSLILLLNFSFSLHLFQLCPPCFGSSFQHASGFCMTTLWIITRVMNVGNQTS